MISSVGRNRGRLLISKGHGDFVDAVIPMSKTMISMGLQK